MTDTSPYTKLIPKPSPDSINTGLSSIKRSTLDAIFGSPDTSKILRRHLTTLNVGPFRVTGMDLAVNLLAETLEDVRLRHPEIYRLLGTAGMFNCRKARGSSTYWSDHAYGLAVDLKIGGVLDARGDNKVQMGLLTIYPIFHAHGWYWGAEYNVEDSMHVSCSAEKFKELWPVYNGRDD